MFDMKAYKTEVTAAVTRQIEAFPWPADADFDWRYEVLLNVIHQVTMACMPPEPLDNATAIAVLTEFPEVMDVEDAGDTIRDAVGNGFRLFISNQIDEELTPMIRTLSGLPAAHEPSGPKL